MNNKLIRLSKLISHAGVCSRKEAETLIKKNYVKINGEIFKDFFIQKYKIKTISVNDKILKKKTTRVWILNKPIGYVCSNNEQNSQKNIFRLISNRFPRMVSVGRLDINSNGLILMTNNPTFSNFLERPENSIERTYLVKVFGNINNIKQINNKSLFINGFLYKDISIRVLTKEANNNLLEIKLTEGKNREIRKILYHFGFKVKKLTRISFGPFRLNELKDGKILEVKNFNLRKILKSLRFKDENYFG